MTHGQLSEFNHSVIVYVYFLGKAARLNEIHMKVNLPSLLKSSTTRHEITLQNSHICWKSLSRNTVGSISVRVTKSPSITVETRDSCFIKISKIHLRARVGWTHRAYRLDCSTPIHSLLFQPVLLILAKPVQWLRGFISHYAWLAQNCVQFMYSRNHNKWRKQNKKEESKRQCA